MTDEDDQSEEGGEISPDTLDARLDDAEEGLEAAETEADLDEAEATLDAVESDIDAAAEEDADDDEDPFEEVTDRLDDLRESLEDQRGPYADDVLDDIDGHQSTIESTRWTANGIPAIQEAVDAFLDAAGDALDTDFGTADEEDPEALVHELDAVADAVEDAGLDPDEDADALTALVAAADDLGTGIEDAEEWNDLEVNEQLRAEGYYDVLGHYKDFPVEWAALKEHEKQGNIEHVLRALDALDSDFMERHCLETITRMGDAGAFDEMHQRAQKRDRPGVKALGKMGDGAVEAVETLVEYVDTDSDPQLQKVTFRALGEIGSEEAVQPLANKLEMDNDNVRPLAARALGLIGDTRAVEPLSDTLETDEDRSVRTAAAWALRQIGTEEALEAAAAYTEAKSYTLESEAEKAQEALDAGDDEAAVEA
jgi:hypothetical protein